MFRFLDISSYFNSLGFAFRALKIRNFRFFFWGQLASLLGTWIQNLALGWLVYKLTNSPFLLGVVGFAGQIPSLLLTPLAGVYADRINKQKVLIVVQCVSMVMAFLMAYLTLTDRVVVWHLIAIASINGMAMAFDTPFRHSFLLDMVGDKLLLQNAIALNSTLINSARFVGPLLGGFLVALIGEGYCFLLNGISFWAVIIALLSMRIVNLPQQKSKNSILSDLAEGLKYSFQNHSIRYLLILVFASSLFGLPFQVFLPYFAGDVLMGGSKLLGILTGLFGSGALIGAFFLATRREIDGLPQKIITSALVFSIALIVFALSNRLYLSFVALPFIGFGMIVLFAATNTFIQTHSESDKRGRVISLYGMSFMGITPIGSLLLGWVSKSAGVQTTLAISATACMVTAAILWRKINNL